MLLEIYKQLSTRRIRKRKLQLVSLDEIDGVSSEDSTAQQADAAHDVARRRVRC